jgi:hydroxymethylbilane synthase
MSRSCRSAATCRRDCRKLKRGEIDGVVLAAAGLQRFALCPAHALDLPLEYCLPAPGQGALAVQMREGDERVEMLRAINDADADVAVRTERALMREIGGACATPLGALATVDESRIMLRGQLFDADGTRHVRDAVRGDDPHALGRELAARLQALLGHTGERDA